MNGQLLRGLLTQKDFLPPTTQVDQLPPFAGLETSVAKQTAFEMVGKS
jgi:hypothetical protein